MTNKPAPPPAQARHAKGPQLAYRAALSCYTPKERRPALTIEAHVQLNNTILQCAFSLRGALAELILPLPAEAAPQRLDGLWQATCLEVFLKDGQSPAYQEFNFSPAHGWNVYQFASYRYGMEPVKGLEPPKMLSTRHLDHYHLKAVFAPPPFRQHPAAVNLAAILLDRSGELHYYTIDTRHTPPDFHNPASFVSLSKGRGS